MAFMVERCSELGECLYTARRIKELGESSENVWRTEWTALAQRVEKMGDDALKGQHPISAKEAYLRASNYYRTAEYCTPPKHPEFDILWQKSVDTFQKAARLFKPEIQTISIDYDGRQLPGYFWEADTDERTRPTLIVAGGADSSLEELIYWAGMAAVRRGYNFFAFDHPGHRGALHLYPDLIKIANYEKPYHAAIDHLQTLQGVDQRVAMTGYSFGGYVTLRTAAFDSRIKVIIPNPAIIHEPFQQQEFEGFWSKIPISWIDSLIAKGLNRKPTVKVWLQYIQWSCGYPGEKWSEMLEIGKMGFSVKDFLHQISCPSLIMVGEKEGDLWVEQAQACYEGISSTHKQLHIFNLDEDGSNDHCQLDNRSRGNQVMFDWLDQVFSNLEAVD